MGFGSSPKIEKPAPVVVPEPEPLPTEVDEAVVRSRTEARRRAALIAGRKSTIATSSSGLTDDDLNTAKPLLSGS